MSNEFYLVEPLDNVRVTQEFGGNYAMYKQFGMKGHNGRDYGCSTGTRITAVADGKIMKAEFDNGYGNYVRQWIEGVGEVVYGHASVLKVKAGDTVKQGDLLALSGNTGFSTGPHLHLGLRLIGADYNNGYKGYIDPKPYLINKQTYMELIDRISKLETYVYGHHEKNLSVLNELTGKQQREIDKLQDKFIKKLKKIRNRFLNINDNDNA